MYRRLIKPIAVKKNTDKKIEKFNYLKNLLKLHKKMIGYTYHYCSSNSNREGIEEGVFSLLAMTIGMGILTV